MPMQHRPSFTLSSTHAYIYDVDIATPLIFGKDKHLYAY